MNWLEEHWLRLVFMVAYLALLVHHCLGGKPAKGLSKDDEQDRGKNTIGDFLTGGRTLGGWVIALSFYATFVSTNTFIGHAGKSRYVGLIWYVKLAVHALTVYLAWYTVIGWYIAQKVDWTNWHEVYAGLVVAIVAYVGVSVLTSPAGRDEVSNG